MAFMEMRDTGERYRGYLKSFSAKDGYGFIECAELFKQHGRDVYMHGSELPPGAVDRSPVCFQIRLNAKKQPQAYKVTLAREPKTVGLAAACQQSPAQALQRFMPLQDGTTGAVEDPAFPSTSATTSSTAEPPLPALPCYQGVVKTFHTTNGYGFVKCEETFTQYGRDVYMHRNDRPEGVRVNDDVQFSVVPNSRGQPQARGVRKVDTREADAMAVQDLLPLCTFFEEVHPGSRSNARERFARIVSWNILAPEYCTSQVFRDAESPSLLRWSRRAAQIAGLLKQLEPDVVCLQEVPVDVRPEDFGLPRGIFGVELLGRPMRTDGCLIAWQQSRFRIVQQQRIVYESYLPPPPPPVRTPGQEPPVDPFQRYRTGHCAILVELQQHSPPGKKLLVVTTHLAWGPFNEDIRLWQLGILLEELQTFHSARVVLCGDLNSLASGQVHRALSSSCFSSVYAGIEEQVATTSNANAVDEDHGSGFSETIDYCWLLSNGDFEARRRLRLPTKEALRMLLGGRPAPSPIPTLVSSGRWPSDHLPVGVEVGPL